MKLNPTRLKLAMKQAGMMQKDLADTIGMQRVTISRYINGEHEPHKINLERMAEALHVTPEFLTKKTETIDSAAAESYMSTIESIQEHARNWSMRQKAELIRRISDFMM